MLPFTSISSHTITKEYPRERAGFFSLSFFAFSRIRFRVSLVRDGAFL